MLCCVVTLIWISLGLFAFAVLFGLFYRATSGVCRSTKRMDGKTVLITGASSGIGKFTARDLASRGARVIIASNNVREAESVRSWIISVTGNKLIEVSAVDLSDLDDVRKFAKKILEKEKRLDVLINNAGIGMQEKKKSAQGFELTMATNYLGHFLLTNLLIGLLKKSAPSRIINVSSINHKFVSLDLNDLHFKRRKFGSMTSYSQSKLCLILFTRRLASLLERTGVTANCLHPGIVLTRFIDTQKSLLNKFFAFLIFVMGKDATLGAQTIIHLAVSDEVQDISGEYFADCKLARSSRPARDLGSAKKLWEITEREVGLRNDEKHF